MDGPLQCSWFDGLRPRSSFPQITIHADGGSLCAVTVTEESTVSAIELLSCQYTNFYRVLWINQHRRLIGGPPPGSGVARKVAMMALWQQ